MALCRIQTLAGCIKTIENRAVRYQFADEQVASRNEGKPAVQHLSNIDMTLGNLALVPQGTALPLGLSSATASVVP